VLDPSPITRGIREVRAGQDGAFERLIGLVYEDLRLLASRHLGENASQRTLSPTGLVHEAYLRLAGREDLTWEDRTHFFAACSVVMRHVVIDFAARAALKRAAARFMTLPEEASRSTTAEEPLALDRALDRLAVYGDRPVASWVPFLRRPHGPEAAAALGVRADCAPRLGEAAGPTAGADRAAPPEASA
jgi:RNA polymerase sigma factor (TIGR02999 family)